MTNTQRIKELAKELFSKYNLNDWYFFVQPLNQRTLGVCQYTTKYIIINSLYVEDQDFSAIEDTLRHEIAHAIAGVAAGHGAKWRAVARAVGANPKATTRISAETSKKHFKYQLAFKHDCGKIELRDAFQMRRSNLSGKMLRGRPETLGKLIWVAV